MRKISILVGLVSLVALLIVPVASAITYGEPDNGRHPNVGALILVTESKDKFPYCSGTLVAPQVFLTAAHCNISYYTGTDKVFVSFDEEITNKSKLIEGTFVGHPNYPGPESNPYDIAVVLLKRPVNNLPLASLPTAGQFDALPHEQPFTAVGYGGSEPVQVPGLGVVNSYLDARWLSISSLNATNDAWLRLSQNNATGDGGTCYGDSGGPNFLGAYAPATGVIAGLTITGDAVCRATNVIYRLDTPWARDFLDDYVAVP